MSRIDVSHEVWVDIDDYSGVTHIKAIGWAAEDIKYGSVSGVAVRMTEQDFERLMLEVMKKKYRKAIDRAQTLDDLPGLGVRQTD
jgi:hypothetical protein